MLIPEIRAIYPCLCLWRGLEQITSTRPWRRMILHFSHIGLTEGRTFTLAWLRNYLHKVVSTRLWRPLQVAATGLKIARAAQHDRATNATCDVSRGRFLGRSTARRPAAAGF